ncbi:MAG TPA: plastocyanin/azurin family copper-binding protein [Longimicrobiales bacterium]|nr:plastocyanin/azurin family copper-binding protein [Longimicrobiales bacterium]
MTSKGAQSRGRLRARRPGLFFGLLLLLIAPGCTQDGAAPRDVVRLETGEVKLPDGAQRHDIRLEGVGAQGEMTPAAVEARIGDAVAFAAADALTHSVVFLSDRLDGAQIAFLESTGQMRGPPLLSEGSTWIVTFAGAPPGDYPFACALHGGAGTIRLAPSD